MHPKLLTGRGKTITEQDLTVAFDWSLHHEHSPQLFSNGRGRANDAVGSSGSAFLASQLELLIPKLVEPLQAVTHDRDLPVSFGGGFPEQLVAYASNYASSGGGSYGLQGTNNTDVPIAQADLEKGSWPTFNWSQGFTLSYIDLKRMEQAKQSGSYPPITLQQLYEKSVRTVWMKALDQVAYFGYLGNPGLVNNTNVPAAVAVNGASGHSTWATKTATEILNDVNFGVNQTVSSSGYNIAYCADRLLVPFNDYALLSQPMSLNGVGWNSTRKYIEENCVAAGYLGSPDAFKILPLPNPWISGQGIGNTAAQGSAGNGLDRAVFYRNHEDSLELKVPTAMTPAMTIPTERGPGYSTFFVGCIGAVMFKRTTTQFFLDGI